MQRSILISFVIASNLLVGCNEPITCGIFDWDESLMRCVCPSETVTQEDGSCLLPDGGVLVPPGHDAGPTDAQVNDGGTDSSVLDGCVPTSYYRDADEDGFGDPGSSVSTCESAPTGYVSNADDCDDDCVDCRPGAAESCNGRDDDCNGVTDGDDLCEFGQGCIDAACLPIPIYQWHATVELDERITGAVRGILVDGNVAGDMAALITYTGTVSVGTTRLGGSLSTTSVALVRFDSAGQVVDRTHLATGGASLRVTGFAMDETGAAYVAGEFIDAAMVLDRDFTAAGRASFVAYQPEIGAGWVQRYGNLFVSALAAHADGFVVCGPVTGTNTFAGESFVADSNGDTLFLWGDDSGAPVRGALMTGLGEVQCTGLDSQGGRTVAVGSYENGGITIGTINLTIPAQRDVWAFEASADGTIPWGSAGGSLYDDVASVAMMSVSHRFVAASTGDGARFGAGPSSAGTNLSLVTYDAAGTPASQHSRLDNDEKYFLLTVVSGCAAGGVAPVLAGNLRTGFEETEVHFGPSTLGSGTSSNGFLVGYSAGGSRPSWSLAIGGPEEDQISSVAAVGSSLVITSGLFETSVDLSSTVTVTDGRAYIVAYRVR